MFASRKQPSQPGGKHTPSLPGLLRTTVIAMALFTVLISAVLIALGWLSGVAVLPLSSGMFSSTQLSDLVRAAVSIGTLAGGTFAAVYAYRKQRIDEATSHRADSEHLNKRYQDAAVQLGHERAAVRLAGIYAIGRLADDWPENRQMCVDLLCAYLRMPYHPGKDSDDESVVRATVFDVIRDHLTDPSNPHSWCDLSFNFSSGTYDKVRLWDCHFHGSVNFSGARFTGLNRRAEGRNDGGIHFEDSVFRADLSLFQATFDGAIVFFDDVRFEDGTLHFGGASFQDFNLFFRDTQFVGGKVYFGSTEFKQRPTDRPLGHVWYDRATFDGAEVIFNGVRFEGAIDMRFTDVEIRSGKLDLSGLVLGEQSREEKSPTVQIKPSFIADGVVTFPTGSSSRLTVELPPETPVGDPERDRPPTETH